MVSRLFWVICRKLDTMNLMFGCCIFLCEKTFYTKSMPETWWWNGTSLTHFWRKWWLVKKEIFNDNIKQKLLRSKACDSSQVVATPRLTARKALLCNFCDWEKIIYYELHIYMGRYLIIPFTAKNRLLNTLSGPQASITVEKEERSVQLGHRPTTCFLDN